MDDIKKIETALREYRSKKSVIETTSARVEAYKNMIKDAEEVEVVLTPQVEPGMPKSQNHGGSQQEYIILKGDAAVRQLQEWIKEENSRIYPLQLEIEQIEGALGALNRQERFVIECKYFERMIWRDIEFLVNDKFRQQNYVTYDILKRENKKALETIHLITKPFYEKFGVVVSMNWQTLKTA